MNENEVLQSVVARTFESNIPDLSKDVHQRYKQQSEEMGQCLNKFHRLEVRYTVLLLPVRILLLYVVQDFLFIFRRKKSQEITRALCTEKTTELGKMSKKQVEIERNSSEVQADIHRIQLGKILIPR